jgi:hypothetical protein
MEAPNDLFPFQKRVWAQMEHWMKNKRLGEYQHKERDPNRQKTVRKRAKYGKKPSTDRHVSEQRLQHPEVYCGNCEFRVCGCVDVLRPVCLREKKRKKTIWFSKWVLPYTPPPHTHKYQNTSIGHGYRVWVAFLTNVHKFAEQKRLRIRRRYFSSPLDVSNWQEKFYAPTTDSRSRRSRFFAKPPHLNITLTVVKVRFVRTLFPVHCDSSGFPDNFAEIDCSHKSLPAKNLTVMLWPISVKRNPLKSSQRTLRNELWKSGKNYDCTLHGSFTHSKLQSRQNVCQMLFRWLVTFPGI